MFNSIHEDLYIVSHSIIIYFDAYIKTIEKMENNWTGRHGQLSFPQFHAFALMAACPNMQQSPQVISMQ